MVQLGQHRLFHLGDEEVAVGGDARRVVQQGEVPQQLRLALAGEAQRSRADQDARLLQGQGHAVQQVFQIQERPVAAAFVQEQLHGFGGEAFDVGQTEVDAVVSTQWVDCTGVKLLRPAVGGRHFHYLII